MKTVLLPHSSDPVLPASAAIIKNVYPFQTENPSVAGLSMPMTTLRIYDYRNGALALDLRDLVDLISPRSLEASWTASPVRMNHPDLGRFYDEFMMTGPGQPRQNPLEVLATNGSSVSNVTFSEAAHAAWQVIWGQFVATLRAERRMGRHTCDRQQLLRSQHVGRNGSSEDQINLQRCSRCVWSGHLSAHSASAARRRRPYVAPVSDHEMTGTFGDLQISVPLKST
jgi:hypothetical protein